MKILVTDGHLKAALSAVRSLGRRGFEVHALQNRPGSTLCSLSAYLCRAHVMPPYDSHAEFDSAFLDLLRHGPTACSFSPHPPCNALRFLGALCSRRVHKNLRWDDPRPMARQFREVLYYCKVLLRERRLRYPHGKIQDTKFRTGEGVPISR